MATNAQSGGKRSGEVQSVVRAAHLLACFAEAESGLTLTELARRTGLNVSTAHRLLGTLCGEGLLCREQGGERFLPGPLLLRLSRSSLLADDLSQISVHLQALAAETRESACFGVRRGDEVAILLASPSPEALRVEVAPGTTGPLFTGALGQTLLAFGDQPLEAVVARAGGRRELRRELLAVQFRGYALTDDVEGEGIRSIAAPVRAVGRVRAALELRGPSSRMRPADGLARTLQQHADAVARLPMAAAL